MSTSSTRRFIFNDDDMSHFLKSSAKTELLRFTQAMGKSCADSSMQNQYHYDPKFPLVGLTPAIAALHGSLRSMLSWISDFPPEVDRSKVRFGNPVFRKWHARLVERSVSICSCIIKLHQEHPESHSIGHFDKKVLQEAANVGHSAACVVKDLDSVAVAEDREVIGELSTYLTSSFGHPVRLDYGTGHECSFQIFLFCLCKLGCFGSNVTQPPSKKSLKAVALSIYQQYLAVTRQIQTDYMLEPAGSHGVWGLDDYHCLPFYFGACQLQSHEQQQLKEGGKQRSEDDDEDLIPLSIHDDSTLKRYGDTYMYFGCIQYIKGLKKGVPFFESSPMLNDISQLATWQKIASGLMRLYEGEVLSKFPVVQHLRFGNIFQADWTPSQSEGQTSAPTENFRCTSQRPTERMVRAPWAVNNDNERSSTVCGSVMPPTKAPWAK